MNIARTKNIQVILYGVSLAVLLFLVKWLQLAFVFINFSVGIYAGVIALLFTGLGICVAIKLIKPKTVIIEKQVPATPDFY
jgi:NarL family two-component system response regulator LiaR